MTREIQLGSELAHIKTFDSETASTNHTIIMHFDIGHEHDQQQGIETVATCTMAYAIGSYNHTRRHTGQTARTLKYSCLISIMS